MALGTCGRCGTFVCSQCATTRAEGRLSCPACEVRIPEQELAGRAPRFWANLIDTFVVTLPPLVGFAIPAFLKTTSGTETGSGVTVVSTVTGSGLAVAMLAMQVYLTNGGQSLGKRLFRIRVVRKDGSPASLGRIIGLRNVVPLVARYVIPFGSLLGIVDAAMIFGDERRCLHDLIADTKVVTVPRDAGPRSVSPATGVSG